MAERRNWPISSTEFGKFVFILVDFGETRILSDTENCILKEGIRQSSNPTDTDIA